MGRKNTQPPRNSLAFTPTTVTPCTAGNAFELGMLFTHFGSCSMIPHLLLYNIQPGGDNSFSNTLRQFSWLASEMSSAPMKGDPSHITPPFSCKNSSHSSLIVFTTFQSLCQAINLCNQSSVSVIPYWLNERMSLP